MQRILEPEVMDTEEEAREYDAMDHSAPNASVVERFLALGGGDGHVLDVGTGPAHIPILLAQTAPRVRVTAIDLADHMLAVARARVAESGLGARIAIEKADAKRLRFPDAHFDGVFSNSILHHIPDPVPFLSEARRVLKPGGTFLVRDLLRPPSEAEAWRLVDQHAVGATVKQRQLFFDSFHAAFTLPEMRAMADRAGLADARLWQSSDRHWTLEIARTA